MSNNQGLIIAGLAVALGFLGRGKLPSLGDVIPSPGDFVPPIGKIGESRSCSCYDGTRITYKEGSCQDACAKEGHVRPIEPDEPLKTTCKVNDNTWESETGNCIDECRTLGFCPEDTQQEFYTCDDGSRHQILGRTRQEICGCQEGYTLNNDGDCEKRTITETFKRYWLCPSGSQIIIPSGLTPAEETQIYETQCGTSLPLVDEPPNLGGNGNEYMQTVPATPRHIESIRSGNLEYETEFNATPTQATIQNQDFEFY